MAAFLILEYTGKMSFARNESALTEIGNEIEKAEKQP